MKSKTNNEKIRERILSNIYGKFDLIEDILTKEEILTLKPRIILKNITDRLSLEEDRINRKTFWSWLRRYRETNKFNSNPSAMKAIKKSNANFVDHPIAEIHDEEWLKKFQPSVPKTNEHTPVIIKVIRSEKNSQKP
jgi:hypothetical protein